MLVTHEGALSRREVAAAVKLLADWVDTNRQSVHYSADLDTVIRLTAELHNVRLSDFQVRQLADAVARSLPPAYGRASHDAASLYDPFGPCAAYLSRRRDPVQALYELLMTAWMEQSEAAQREPTLQALPGAADRFTRATNAQALPGWFCLLAHEPNTGRALLPEKAIGLSLGSAILAELILSGRVRVEDGGRLLVPGHRHGSRPTAISQTAEQALARAGSEGKPLRRWLHHLEAVSAAQVRDSLVGAGLTRRANSRRRLTDRTCYTAVSPIDVSLLLSSVAGPASRGAVPSDPAKAVLLELGRISGLAAQRATAWLGVDALPKRAGLAAVPSPCRDDLALLLDVTEAGIAERLTGPAFSKF